MAAYIVTDTDGKITMASDVAFPGSVQAAEEVVRGYDGCLYLKSSAPAVPQAVLDARAASELKAQLDALDAKYLTPRVLAGLVTGDSFAQARWQQHETEAAPIRAQIAALG